MNIEILNDLYSDENTYFLIENNEILLIDPGAPIEKITQKANGRSIKYILLTHCHFDHILSVNELIEKYNAKLFCTYECAENIRNYAISLTEIGLGNRMEIKRVEGILNEEDGFDFFNNHIKVIKTPGHTNCSTCFLVDNMLFSGDTIFKRSVGRCDLPTGDGELIKESIKNKIYSLAEDIVIYPGHGDKTSVGYEKKFNFYVNI